MYAVHPNPISSNLSNPRIPVPLLLSQKTSNNTPLTKFNKANTKSFLKIEMSLRTSKLEENSRLIILAPNPKQNYTFFINQGQKEK